MNVYEASQKRLAYLFGEFENILVSFSGGKDSGVLLNLVIDYAKEHDLLHKVSVVHLDYEAQYQMTTDYVEETFQYLSTLPLKHLHWLCLPVYAQCACRIDAGFWIPWEKSKKDIWVREMPTHPYVINEDNCQFKISEEDYEIPKDYFRWFVEENGRTVSLIGIRIDESLDRRVMINAVEGVIKKYDNKKWIIDNAQHELLYSAYPIYDWKTEDIWVYNARFNKPYNRLYDIFYQAGLTVDKMRVASPFNDAGVHNIRLYQVIDPKNWGKMVGRVHGANFAGIYGGTTLMGWRRITKPIGHTWKSYCYFLLDTLPKHVKEHYLEKLNVSIKSWQVGGARDQKIIDDLIRVGAPVILTGETNKRSKTGKQVIRFEDYPDDVDIADFKSVPSYKRMCVCIMKNDWHCTYMGFARNKTENEKRKNAMAKYENILERKSDDSKN